ncbi:hypothetical protein I4U23_023045 [Adineta vaga]|nr:hypothetical protein I4U23_023045 [Adineta vaga]
MPLELIIGFIGNSLNAIIFTRPTLRSWSVSHYFLCSALDRLAIYPLFILNMLADGYGIDIKTYSSISCKLFTYLDILLSVFSPSFLILATIDRFCLSSLNTNLRKFSTTTISNKLIFTIVIFFSLFFIHIFFMYDIIPGNSSMCTTTNILYKKFLIITVAILTSYLPTILFLLFSILIGLNIRKRRQLFDSLLITRQRRQQQSQRTDQELILLLITQVIINFTCSTPYNVISLLIHFYYSETQILQLNELITAAHVIEKN